MENSSQHTDLVFIDSGKGGIPYMTYLVEKRPDVKCVYIADTQNFPYGEKTHEQICETVSALCRKIIERFSPKEIVMACNTMSVNTLDLVREQFPDTKFVGTVPPIKLASSVSKKRCIGMLATSSTVNHPYNKKLMEEFASDCKLILRADPKLISFIEHNSFNSTKQQKLNAVKPAVDFFKNAGCDVIMLACTHFLNLSQEFKEVCGADLTVVDSKEGVVKRALSLLDLESTESEHNNEPELYVTKISSNKDEKEYSSLCSRYNITWNYIF